MNRQLLKDSFGWGFVLWLIGYILGIVLFFVLPSSLIGWVIMPVGVVVTLWVLMRRVRVNLLQHFVTFLAYTTKTALTVTLQSESVGNFEADTDQWTVPINLLFSRWASGMSKVPLPMPLFQGL